MKLVCGNCMIVKSDFSETETCSVCGSDSHYNEYTDSELIEYLLVELNELRREVTRINSLVKRGK